MPSDESRLIETLRVVCIVAMMWVHVNPGLGAPSAVTAGDYALVGTLLGQTLGRVSVALLSFVSGYLLWHRARGLPLARFAAGRFRAVMVPMLVWSAIYILLAVMKAPFTGTAAAGIARIGPQAESLANAWAGITGPTANRALFFLRDLFVGALILRAALPVLARAPVATAAIVLLAGADRALEPVIFRPMILQFLVFGAVAGRLGWTLTSLSRPFVALPIGHLLAIASVAAFAGPGNPLLSRLNLPALALRAGVCLLLLALTRVLIAGRGGFGLHRLGRHAYLAYLIHVPLFGVLWALWRPWMGGAQAPSYVVFFLAAPAVAFAVAVGLGRALDRAPAALQLALRGRVFRPAPPGPAERPLDRPAD